MSDSANNGIPYVPQNTLDPAAGLNLALRVIDSIFNTQIETMALSAPPFDIPSPSSSSSSSSEIWDGMTYVVKATGTGAWAGHDNALAVLDLTSRSWKFYEAGDQAHFCFNKEDASGYRWDPAFAQWARIYTLDAMLIPFHATTSSGLSSTNLEDAINELAERP